MRLWTLPDPGMILSRSSQLLAVGIVDAKDDTPIIARAPSWGAPSPEDRPFARGDEGDDLTLILTGIFNFTRKL